MQTQHGKDIRNRFKKGYDWEMEVQNILDNLKKTYLGNPKEFDAWMLNKGKGADIILPNAEVECKFLKKRVFSSWILRDYIPRFNFHKKYAIIVTNWKWYIPKDCRMLLYDRGIKVMDLQEFIWWLISHQSINKLSFNRGYGRGYNLNSCRMVYHSNGYIISKLKDFG